MHDPLHPNFGSDVVHRLSRLSPHAKGYAGKGIPRGPWGAWRRYHRTCATRGRKREAAKGIPILSGSRAYRIPGAVHASGETNPPHWSGPDAVRTRREPSRANKQSHAGLLTAGVSSSIQTPNAIAVLAAGRTKGIQPNGMPHNLDSSLLGSTLARVWNVR